MMGGEQLGRYLKVYGHFDAETLCDTGPQLFEFNLRSHGDTEDKPAQIKGRFFMHGGRLSFLMHKADGTSDIIQRDDDFEGVVMAYYRFFNQEGFLE